MRVTFMIRGVFVLELQLPIDPDPQNIVASMTHYLGLALQNPALADAHTIHDISYAPANFGSQDELENFDIELDEETNMVIWMTPRPRLKVARKLNQMIEVPEILGELRGGHKKRRLSDTAQGLTLVK